MGHSLKQKKGSDKYRCAKCLTVFTYVPIRDTEGQCFCSKFCRSEWWAEERRRCEEVYGWWKGE